MKRVTCVLALAVLGLAGATHASAESGVNRVIQPGQGIGKVRFGMTLPQVRKALGRRPVGVVRNVSYGAAGRYVEYSWEFPGGRGADTWTVGFRSTTESGTLRAVRVATTVARERTHDGLGVGSRPRQIVAVHRGATCITRSYFGPYKGSWVVVQHRTGGMTAYLLDTQSVGFPAKPPSYRVTEVLLQGDWFSADPSGPCTDDWSRR